MLVIVGANGRTGVAIVREALRQGLDVRPVVRDDHDARHLNGLLDVQKVCYADADQPASLPPVLEGARQVVCCIDPRTAGPGAPPYGRRAAGNVARAADEAGAEVVLHMSVMNPFRWHRARLNRCAFHLEEWVQRWTDRWAILRVSCYHDEVIEGHVRPPDGGRPAHVQRVGRYSPMSRDDAARVAVQWLGRPTPGRAQCIGGPELLWGEELERRCAPHRSGARPTGGSWPSWSWP
jgi:uncharacterized protein YbjT (DUF2867 family)